MGARSKPDGGSAAGGGAGDEPGDAGPAAVHGPEPQGGVGDAYAMEGEVARIAHDVRDDGPPARDGDPLGEREPPGDPGVPGAGDGTDRPPEGRDVPLGPRGGEVHAGQRAETGHALDLPERGERPPRAGNGPGGHTGVDDPYPVQMGLTPVDQPVPLHDLGPDPYRRRPLRTAGAPVHGHGHPQRTVSDAPGPGGGSGQDEQHRHQQSTTHLAEAIVR
ncbi:hypothetical protein [Streptomyces sp. NPDC056194]|uniref:hypothetical protein n=1 Tax=unclassified Streptomyces TaxID=2593676 RepID=UPI0035E17300